MTLQTVTMIWWSSIVLLLVVAGVVALLLALVLRSSRTILSVAGDIWTAGKMVANNTIHIPLLAETNRLAGAILATTDQIDAGAEAIQQHTEGCPGCPDCVLSS